MATWYIAPDGLVKPGLVFSTIGTSGYGHSLGKCVKWSDFQVASGAWVNRADNDIWIFISGYLPYITSNAASWSPLTWNKSSMQWLGQTVDGTPAPALFVGTRDWPWPKDGSTAVYNGETVIQYASTAFNPYFNMIHFKNVKYSTTTQNNGTGTDYGQITFEDCVSTNTTGGLFTTQTKTDGRANLVMKRSRNHGYNGATHRLWANNSGRSVDLTDCFFDSEHQNDHPTFNAAQATCGVNVKDSIPGVATVKSAASVTRVVSINNAAGLTGSGYQQGDGLIFEENTGTVTVKDLLTFGNGDRGLDAKCAGTVVRMNGLGDGTGAAGHHLDTVPMVFYNPIMRAGARITTATGGVTASACLQSSGWTRTYMGWLSCRPTQTQASFNGYGVTSASVDPQKGQSSIPGGIHQGKVELIDTHELVNSVSVTGPAEQQGYSGASNSGRIGFVFGLTPSTAYNFQVRAMGPTGLAGTFTSNIPFTTIAAGGDMTGPAAPTGLTATALTGGTQITFTWNSIAEDSGVSIQGYCLHIDFGDGNGYVPTMPLKSCSPLTLDGFKPATAYNVKIAAYDANANMGTLSSLVAVTTLSGSVSATTPGTPTNTAVDGGWPQAHPTAVCIGAFNGGAPSTGWTAASGTTAYSEIWDSGAVVIKARIMTVPTAGSAPTLTKTNTTLVTS